MEQELFSVHCKELAIDLADQLLDESGKLHSQFKKIDYTLSPSNYNDSDITEHQLRILEILPSLAQRLQSFSLPLCDSKIEEMIATMFGVEELTDRHVIWAVLSALLCPLRQSVGSCFATAPAILVHEQMPQQFLKDLQDLLYTGQLRRTFGGREFNVPISPSIGAIEKGEHFLLKTWEYTLASFVDVKTEFSRWNLYSSLGLHAEEMGGIGQLVYDHLQKKLEEANEKLDHFQHEYEIAFDQVRSTESLMRSVSTEADARRLKNEHQARVYHLRSCEEMRDRYHFRAHSTANFFSFFLEGIEEKFQEHFQEVYDAEMQEVSTTPYDDSPAGFRLLYKHGRSHVKSWTFIHNSEEYIQALRQFFTSIEHSLIELCQWKEGKEEIPPLITAIVHHLNTEEFLASAFRRMAKAHRTSFEKKPWAYTSGGTLPTLLKTYFRREGAFSEEARWVESPQDLLIFFLDILKMAPTDLTRILATSPTHVFSLLPQQKLFRNGWEDPGFTYTWVRDQILRPRKKFYQKLRLESFEQRLLGLETPSEKPLSISAFREKLPPSPQIDSFLFEMLPLITPAQAEAIIQKLDLKILAPFKPIGRRPFHDLLISAYESHQSVDRHAQIATLLEKEGLAPPRALIVADTNWSKFYFSFVVNPATQSLELWRTDKIGLTGAPMREWDHFLNGAVKENWSVYFRPYEYQA